MGDETLVRRHAREPFELLQELGRGGFATTYRARILDPELLQEFGRSEVAVKIPLNRQKERALHRELELNAGLHLRLKGATSVNLVRYLGFEVFRGQVVMVMEYAAQGSLRGLMGPFGRQRRLPVERAVALAEGILNGLALIHREHVFHRDIKPENILLHEETPKIADLGIGRLLESEQMASTQIGTLPYMSPEILGSEGASFTSDLWSLAVTLYEMVTGRLPFGDEQTPIRVMIEMICCHRPIPASELCPEVGPELSDIIARALSKKPTDRYPSAVAMADALRAFREPVKSVKSVKSVTPGDDALATELTHVRSMMAHLGEAGKAEQRLAQLIERYPRDPRPLQCLGELHAHCQRYPDAIAAIERAILLQPGNGLLHFNLALAYQGEGQPTRALESLQRALALPLEPNVRHHAALLKRALKGGAA